jgi:hypothetical protein
VPCPRYSTSPKILNASAVFEIVLPLRAGRRVCHVKGSSQCFPRLPDGCTSASLAGTTHKRKERSAKLVTHARTTTPLLAKLPAATACVRRELKTGRAPSNHPSLPHPLHFAPTLHLPQPFVLLSPYTYTHLNHSFYTYFSIPFLVLSIHSSNLPSFLYQLRLPCRRRKRDRASLKPRLLKSQAAFLYHTNAPPLFDKLNKQ